MAFWGIEVRPGKPFTHTADDARGRLHISQATLGIGTATKKSIVQCNVGNKSPVFLCSLFPEKAESCQLNLEFEEADEVMLSVIGPRSVHLTGYFIGRGTYYKLNDESESYGEDIADTETERSTGHSNDDKYEDSFINDDDPEVFLSSPIFDSEEIEGTPGRRAKNVKGSHRRLRKKYQLSESDDDVDAEEHMVVNGTEAEDSESEDMLPISSLCKVNPTTVSEKLEDEEKVVEKSVDTKPSTDNGKLEAEETAGKKSYETSNYDAKDERHCSPISENTADVAVNVEPKRPKVGPKNTEKPKKKKKAQPKEGKDPDIDVTGSPNVLKEDKAPQNYTQTDKIVPHLPVEEKQEASNYNSKDAHVPPDFLLPSTQMGSESDAKPKKRKRKEHTEEKIIEANSDLTNLKKDGNTLQDEVKPNSMGQDLPVRNEQNEKESNPKIFQDNSQSAVENQSVERKKKKKKKRRTIEDGKVMDIETPLQSMDAKSGSTMDIEKISGESKLSQLKTLPGGVVIEELEAGKPNGKVATSGKKITVHYTGKLKENGQVFESTLDGTPFKFHLGRKEVIDGFDVGLEGMRVGEKRRILIPPLMGFGIDGGGKSVPPSSSLVYDVKLVKVHR